MIKNKLKVEEFEKEYKENIFRKISESSSKQLESIKLITTSARNIGKINENIPNSSITLNNKLVELSNQFRKAGISMFSSKLADYDIVSSSFLCDALINDLVVKLSKS